MSFVHCSDTASFAINRSGRLYCWGTPLPSNSVSDVSSEQLQEVLPMAPFADVRFKKVTGNKHRYAAVSFAGELFVFGVK